MRQYFGRHGLTVMNQAGVVNGELDDPLVEEGIQQARDAVATVPKTVKHILTSPLSRAVDTATIYGTALNIPVLVVPELIEVKMGLLAGNAWPDMENGAELKRLHRSVQYDYRSYGGESVKDVVDRLRPQIQDITETYNEGEVLMITHGGICRTLELFETGEATYESQGNTVIRAFDLSKILTNMEALNG